MRLSFRSKAPPAFAIVTEIAPADLLPQPAYIRRPQAPDLPPPPVLELRLDDADASALLAAVAAVPGASPLGRQLARIRRDMERVVHAQYAEVS